MGLWDQIRNLRLHVTGFRLEELQTQVHAGFRRLTTVVVLTGPGAEAGRGEDVCYGAREQELFRRHGPELRDSLVGAGDMESFSERLGALELFAEAPEQAAYHDYRRWAFESAALDLALRQNGLSLAAAFGHESRALRYVVSMRLPEPPSIVPLQELRSRYPSARFKLDLEASWTVDFMAELHALGLVDVVDLKGMYSGTIVDLEPNAAAYDAVACTLEDAWIEDPWLDAKTEPVLREAMDRVTWDAPIHSIEDVRALATKPKMLNSKPSRFGTWKRLLDFYDYCRENDIALYAGGQFELGVGRDQIQCLAALFHPDAPNDCAPRGFNAQPVRDGLPASPWVLPIAVRGFGFRTDSHH